MTATTTIAKGRIFRIMCALLTTLNAKKHEKVSSLSRTLAVRQERGNAGGPRAGGHGPQRWLQWADRSRVARTRFARQQPPRAVPARRRPLVGPVLWRTANVCSVSTPAPPVA